MNFSIEEIGDLRHILVEAEGKLSKLGLNKEAIYIQGVVEMIEEMVADHNED